MPTNTKKPRQFSCRGFDFSYGLCRRGSNLFHGHADCMNGFCFCPVIESFQRFLESEICKGCIGSEDVIGMRDIPGSECNGFRNEFTFAVFHGNVADTLTAESPGRDFDFLNGNIIGDEEDFIVQGFVHVFINTLFKIFPLAAGFDPEFDELRFVEVGETEKDLHFAAISHIILEIGDQFHAAFLNGAEMIGIFFCAGLFADFDIVFPDGGDIGSNFVKGFCILSIDQLEGRDMETGTCFLHEQVGDEVIENGVCERAVELILFFHQDIGDGTQSAHHEPVGTGEAVQGDGIVTGE